MSERTGGKRPQTDEASEEHGDAGDPFLPVKKIVRLLDQRYTIEMLVRLAEKETMRHKDFLDIAPNTTVGYRLRDLQKAGLVTSRPTISTRPIKEYFLTALGKNAILWLKRTKRALSSPAKTKKMEEFKDFRLRLKDETP